MTPDAVARGATERGFSSIKTRIERESFISIPIPTTTTTHIPYACEPYFGGLRLLRPIFLCATACASTSSSARTRGCLCAMAWAPGARSCQGHARLALQILLRAATSPAPCAWPAAASFFFFITLHGEEDAARRQPAKHRTPGRQLGAAHATRGASAEGSHVCGDAGGGRGVQGRREARVRL